ncbi:polyubiquitin-like [Dysidea avara]|uniref:polyubiquitin-like n=1 Tax=Dysidea avara TaxID=196820 RepID=UPI00331DAAEC
MRIFVKTLNGKTVSLEVEPTEYFETVKLRLFLDDPALKDDARLIYAGKQLEDSLTPSDYCIQNESTLHVVARLLGAGPISVSVKSLTGRTITVQIDPGETILVLKKRIFDKLTVPVDHQRLIYNTIQLEDNKKTVSEYGIQGNATIHLVVRIPGGQSHMSAVLY